MNLEVNNIWSYRLKKCATEKIRRLRPAVDRFLHWKLCEATFMTDTIPAAPKLEINSTKLKAEVIVLKESMAQMEIEHANELLAKDRVIGELQNGFDKNLKQIQVARDEITKLNEELRQNNHKDDNQNKHH